jgi:membrane protease YdiL (CAAX protease family)
MTREATTATRREQDAQNGDGPAEGQVATNDSGRRCQGDRTVPLAGRDKADARPHGGPGLRGTGSSSRGTWGRAIAIETPVTPVRPATFFALTYLLSWLIWIPLVASHFGIGPLAVPEGTSNLVRLFGVLMPAVSAVVLSGRAEGRAGVGRLLGRLRIWRVGWRPWAAAVVVPPGLLVAIGAIWAAAGGSPPIEVVDVLSFGALAVNLVFLLIASVGEEIGWRGVALPGLEQRASALRASLVLGLL